MKNLTLLCLGSDELRAAIDRRPPSACSYTIFDFGSYRHQTPQTTILAESGNYWDLAGMAQKHERLTGHLTRIE